MLQLPGAPAYSAFRIQKLSERIQQIDSRVTAVDGRFIHFVELEQTLSDAEQLVLRRLLESVDTALPEVSHAFWVVPRIGTISPWSSKATDIAHNCGLSSVKRIERGIRYDLCLSDGGQLEQEALDSILPLIHDRMTESVLTSAEDAQSLFRQAEPAPFTSVDVLLGGREALEEETCLASLWAQRHRKAPVSA